jgi:Ni/Co efflux regulator RcnB
MKPLIKVVTLVLAATIAAAPAPLLAQQKQDTMDKKESSKSKKKPAKKKPAAKKKSEKPGETNPNPGPK